MATPSITDVTGDKTTGGAVTISGSKFGTKSPAKPQVWCDFSGPKGGSGGSISAPSSLGLVTSWVYGDQGRTTGGWVYYANAGRVSYRGGVKLNTTLYNGEPDGASELANRHYGSFYTNALSQKSFIWREKKRFHSADDGGANSKTLMWQGYPDRYTSVANMVLNEANGSAGQIQTQQVLQPDPPGFDAFYLNDGDNWTSYADWMIQEYVLQTNATYRTFTPNNKTFCNGQLTGYTVSTDVWNRFICMRGASGDLAWDQTTAIYHGYFHATGSLSSYQEYYDAIYIDDTWARVYIGDRSTWAANATKWYKQIQVPVTWGSTSIEVNFQTGTFTTDQTAYLYVVNSDGEVNATGYPITIGDSGGDPPTGTITLSVR